MSVLGNGECAWPLVLAPPLTVRCPAALPPAARWLTFEPTIKEEEAYKGMENNSQGNPRAVFEKVVDVLYASYVVTHTSTIAVSTCQSLPPLTLLRTAIIAATATTAAW